MKYQTIKTAFSRGVVALTFLVLLQSCRKEKDKPATLATPVAPGPDKNKVSILGRWQVYGTTQYALDFTNYGIVFWTHKPHVSSDLKFTYSGTTLTVSGINGTASFSDEGNTLTITGFSDPSAFGAEGAKGPFINGTYIRQ